MGGINATWWWKYYLEGAWTLGPQWASCWWRGVIAPSGAGHRTVSGGRWDIPSCTCCSRSGSGMISLCRCSTRDPKNTPRIIPGTKRTKLQGWKRSKERIENSCKNTSKEKHESSVGPPVTGNGYFPLRYFPLATPPLDNPCAALYQKLLTEKISPPPWKIAVTIFETGPRRRVALEAAILLLQPQCSHRNRCSKSSPPCAKCPRWADTRVWMGWTVVCPRGPANPPPPHPTLPYICPSQYLPRPHCPFDISTSHLASFISAGHFQNVAYWFLPFHIRFCFILWSSDIVGWVRKCKKFSWTPFTFKRQCMNAWTEEF